MDDELTMSEIATLLGLEPGTIPVYKLRAKKARKAGKDDDALMPPPDRMVGRTPVWKRSTVERWDAARRTMPKASA